MRSFRLFAPSLLLLLLPGAVALRAQTASTGALGGVVHDPSGASVPDAQVRLQSLATGTTITSATDRLGEFLFANLAPGSYRVRIAANGFDALQIQAEEIELGRITRIAPLLQIGGVTQSIIVQALDDLPQFDAPVNANLSPSDLRALPLDGRRFQSLAPLTPLVDADDAAPTDPTDSNGAGDGNGTDDPAPDTDNVRLVVRGLDPMHNQYALDGLSLTRAFDGEPRGGRTLPFTVAEEGVREFQVRAVGEGTARGRDAGGSVNTVSRRGEDAVHGSAFFLLRNSGVGASNPFAISTRYNNGSPTSTPVKPRDLREQFGGSVGGPLLRSAQTTRVFGFVAAEGQRRSFPGVSSPSDPNFYKLSAIQTALLANRGVNAAATAKALNFLDGLTGSVARRADEMALFPRVDWQPGARTSVTADWAHVRFRSPSGQRSAAVVPRGRASFGDITTHTDSASLHATTAFSAHWLGTVRAQYSRDAAFAETPAPLASEPQTGPGGAAPEVSVAGVFTFGNAASLGARRLPEERRTEVAAETSFNGRAHTVRLGVDFSAIDDRIGSRSASSGAYSFSSGTTNGRAGGLVDFITDATYSATSYPNGGCPSIYAAVHLFCFQSFTQTFGAVPETRFHTDELNVFADDTWRATTRLRLSAGVRYEYNRLPPPQHPNAALDAVLVSIADGFAASATMPADTNNLAPHIGIAYAPGGRTMIRASYGVHFGNVPGRTLQAALENTAQPASQTRLRLTPRTVLDPSCASAGTNFGYPATYACSPFGPVAAAGAATVFAGTFQMPFVQTGEFSVTRDVTRSTTLDASYVFGLNRQLANTTDLNIAPSTSRVAFQIVRSGGETGARGGDIYNVPLYTARRSTAYGPITGILSNGNGTYNALAIQLRQRASHGLSGRLSWTYSKALDNVRTTGAVPNENAQLDPFEPLYDRAPSNFDRPHRVVAALVWEPKLTGSLPLRIAANGWSLSPVVLVTSGRPYSYEIVGGTALTGGRESLNGSGGSTALPSVGRNTQRLPWTENADLRLARTFSAGERLKLRLTAEAFNLLNHVNVTAVQQRAFLPGIATGGITPLVFQDTATIATEGLTSRPFGTASSSSDSPTRERRVQAGFRLDW
ncbi:MAG: carboxypeptidase regulatory-like domain-containing protein [Janthinobacterium lividum]